jgi:hypothetical protein
MKEVKLHNMSWTQQANKKKAHPKKKKAATSKHHNATKAVKASTNKSTSLVKRPAMSPASVQKYINMGKAMQRNASGGTVAKAKPKKNKTAKKANGSRSFLSRIFGGSTQIRSNPGLGDFGAIIRTAGFGVIGGASARLASSVVLAIGDRVAPTWTQSKWASPVVTLLSALFIVPRVASYIGLRDASTNSLMQTGGILFAASEVLNIVTNGDKVAEWSDSLRASLGTKIGAGGGSTATTNQQTDAAVAAATAAAAQAAAARNTIGRLPIARPRQVM